MSNNPLSIIDVEIIGHVTPMIDIDSIITHDDLPPDNMVVIVLNATMITLVFVSITRLIS